MRKRLTASLLAGSAAALAIGLGVTSVFASTGPTAKTTAASKKTASSDVTFPFKATASTATIKDGKTPVLCSAQGSTKASTATATLDTGTGNAIGTVGDITFSNCSLAAITLTIKADGEPYPLQVDSTTASSGETDVLVSNVDFAVTGPGCSLVVTGSALGYFAAGNRSLTMKPVLTIKPTTGAKLTISDVSGCFGFVKDGDHPTLTAAYNLTPVT